MLGECQSKCEHIAGVPLRPDVAENLHRIYLAKGARATTAIEGNTLSENEVLQAVRGDLKLPPSREYLKREIDNILGALNGIWEQVGIGNLPQLTLAEFEQFNRLVLTGLEVDDGVVPGRIRTHEVGVGRYRGAPAEDCRYLLERLATWLESPGLRAPPGMAIVWGIIRAVAAHLYMAWIHPFGDGNGRTARLVEYRILLASGAPSPAVHLLSNHYNLTRSEYYRQLERASASGGDYVPFFEYAVSGFLDGLREQISEIRKFQLDIIWRNYVHEAFGDRKTNVEKRRRDLVLALSYADKPVRVAEIPDLGPSIAVLYHGTSRMLLNRDLNALGKMGLLVRSRNGILANKRMVEAFLQFRFGGGQGGPANRTPG
ncbi:MAG: Fic family protein [Gemmataceae bacterium]|nr:Fic family protein [Gemmataceae bacterium]